MRVVEFLEGLLASKKTKWLIICLALLFLIIFVVAALAPKDGKILRFPTTASSAVYYLDAADSLSQQQLGLGGKDSMPADHGMIFLYQNQARRCFWMKDMRFALDVIWLDSSKRIVHIERNLKPQTYPKKYCHHAQYVTELNAGQATRLKIHDRLSF